MWGKFMNELSILLIVFGIIVLFAIIALCLRNYIRNYKKARAREETQAKTKFIDQICVLLRLRQEHLKETQAKAALVQFAQYTKQSSQSTREIFDAQAPECITAAHRAMDNVVDKYFRSLDKCIETECDDLYLPAVKAILPKQKWHKEFEEKLSAKIDTLIPRDELSNDLKAAEANAIIGLTNLLNQTESMHLSPEMDEGLTYLVNNPDKLNQLLDQSDPLREIMELQHRISRDVISYALQQNPFLKQILEDTNFTLLILEQLDLITDIIINVCLTVIQDWVVHLVGEEALSEALEWIATAVIPIVGQIMLIWKLVKYGNLARKLIITKEPLQRLRRRLRDECRRIINETGELAKEHVSKRATKINSEVDNYLTALEKSCDNVIEANPHVIH